MDLLITAVEIGAAVLFLVLFYIAWKDSHQVAKAFFDALGGMFSIAVLLGFVACPLTCVWSTLTHTNKPPNASAEVFPLNVSVHKTINCSGEASEDWDGTIKSYAWDFGDGTSGEGAKAAHAYASPGMYSVRLQVIDNNGANSSVSREVNVTEKPLATIKFSYHYGTWLDSSKNSTVLYDFINRGLTGTNIEVVSGDQSTYGGTLSIDYRDSQGAQYEVDNVITDIFGSSRVFYGTKISCDVTVTDRSGATLYRRTLTAGSSERVSSYGNYETLTLWRNATDNLMKQEEMKNIGQIVAYNLHQ